MSAEHGKTVTFVGPIPLAIRAVANGWVVQAALDNSDGSASLFASIFRAYGPYVFETLDSLFDHLRAHFAKPDKAAP